MVLFGPRPYLIGFDKRVLAADRQYFTATIPAGAPWRLLYFLVDYPVVAIAGVQATRDLFFTLFDADGRTFSVDPILLKSVTTPSGFSRLGGTNPINVDYMGGVNLKFEIASVAGAGNLPATISITLFGMRSWSKGL